MAKAVGFLCNVKLPWLDRALELEQENLPLEEKKARLQEYLAFEISSPTILRKTREILLHIWAGEYANQPDLRLQAMLMAEKYPADRLIVHWCMMLTAYPLFADLCRIIGKLSEFQETFTLAQIRQKLFDEWGERVALQKSLGYLMQTMVELGALERVQTGCYRIAEIPLEHAEMVNFAISAVIHMDHSAYYTIQSLRNAAVLFPFRYTVSREQIVLAPDFDVSTFGGELMVSLKQAGGRC